MAKVSIKKKAAATAEAQEFKYGIDDVAKALDIQPASARIKLRQAQIKKAGKSYGWNSRADLEAVVAKFNSKGATKKTDKKTPKK